MFRSSVLFGRGAMSASALAVAVVLACPAQAQSDLGTIEGHVEGVAVGTPVTATDTWGATASNDIDPTVEPTHTLTFTFRTFRGTP